VVHANRHQIRARGGLRSDRLREEFYGLRIERVERNGAFAEPSNKQPPFVHGQHQARPEVCEKGP